MGSCYMSIDLEPKKIFETFRGIRTNPLPKNETGAKTIRNRLGQLSISLPRIDNKKRWAGYPGLTGWARPLAQRIDPECKYYIEPFAGTAKVFQEFLKLDRKEVGTVLNDKSMFVYNWLLKEFENKAMAITNHDFQYVINFWDSKNAFFMFDQPWNKSFYDQNFSCFDRTNTGQYDLEVLEACNHLEGNFIITTRKENERMLNSGFFNYLIKSEYVVSGHYPELLVTTNLKQRGLKHV